MQCQIFSKKLVFRVIFIKICILSITYQKPFSRFLPSSLGERFGDSAASSNTEWNQYKTFVPEKALSASYLNKLDFDKFHILKLFHSIWSSSIRRSLNAIIVKANPLKKVASRALFENIVQFATAFFYL